LTAFALWWAALLALLALLTPLQEVESTKEFSPFPSLEVVCMMAFSAAQLQQQEVAHMEQ
jgi:hypothetical protein